MVKRVVRRARKCKRSADGKHVPEERARRRGHVYGMEIRCFVCGKKLRRWKKL